MTPEIFKTLMVIGGVFLLFLWNRWRLEVVGFIALVAVIALDLLEPTEAVAGFANEATITVGLMLGLSSGLVRTGVVDSLGTWIGRLGGDRDWRLLAVLLLIVVPTSAFLNNTAVVAILIPMVMGLCRDGGVAPSRILMPLSFGSQLGGTLTLIGTSTNLIVAGMVLDYGMKRIDIFTITPPALILTIAGVAYLMTVGRWLTPVRESPTGAYAGAGRRAAGDLVREYLAEFEVSETEASPLTAERLESDGLRVVGVLRDGEWREMSGAEELESGDRIVVRGSLHDLAEARADERMQVEAGSAARTDDDADLKIAEMLVSPASRAVGRTVADVQEGLPDAVRILAVDRHGSGLERPVWNLELNAGDLLLVTGARSRLQSLHRSGDYALLGVVELPRRRTTRMPVALGILMLVVVVAAFGVTTIMVSALAGVVAMFVTGCVRPAELYEDMDWGVLLLLGSLLGLGRAMESTGTAGYVAEALLGMTSGFGPYGVLATFYLLSTLLTSVVTNNTAALVLTPVAVETAQSMGVSPLPMVVAVMIAASNSFVTPVGYQTNTFVYSPGGYRFLDFARVGGPLLLLMLPIATWAIPFFLPF